MMKKILKIALFSLSFALIGFAVLSVFLPVPLRAQINIQTTFPGQSTTQSTTQAPGTFVNAFYTYALSIAGIIAFGIIVYGGVKYMVSTGNPSATGDAKEWIKAALLGILLLAGAYMILHIVNPSLTNLALPTLGTVAPVAPSIPPTTGGGNQPTSGGGTPGCPSCVQLPNCTVTAHTNCGGAPAMDKLVSCIAGKDPNFVVNEGYPPTVSHSDPGHNTGCAIDVHVPNCDAIAPFTNAANACGARDVLNEYAQCAGSKTYKTTTGGNIHIDAPTGSGGC